MGITFAITLLIENAACRGLEGPADLLAFCGPLAVYGAFAGLVGSGVRLFETP